MVGIIEGKTIWNFEHCCIKIGMHWTYGWSKIEKPAEQRSVNE